MHDSLQPLLHRQGGVLARRQALECGLSDNDLRRLVRRREFVRVHPGVFVSHTGEPSWEQRAWAAVLWAWPAALCDVSALQAHGLTGSGPGAPIRVAVPVTRHPSAVPGVVVRRTRDFDAWVQWSSSPPRIRLEMAVVRMADAAPGEHDCVRILTDAVGSRRTTADRLLATIEQCTRLRRRKFLTDVARDVATGVHSVLERGYLHRVESAHGLPPALRQVRAGGPGGRAVHRDAVVAAYDLVVELDGHTHHAAAEARHRDLDRDLAAAVDGFQTVRLGWGQVYGDPCGTARTLAELLRVRGWGGRAQRCPSCV